MCGNRYTIVSIIECEYHLLLECRFYQDLRTQCVEFAFEKTLFNFKTIMMTTETKKLRSLAFFIWKAFSLRSDYYADV